MYKRRSSSSSSSSCPSIIECNLPSCASLPQLGVSCCCLLDHSLSFLLSLFSLFASLHHITLVTTRFPASSSSFFFFFFRLFYWTINRPTFTRRWSSLFIASLFFSLFVSLTIRSLIPDEKSIAIETTYNWKSRGEKRGEWNKSLLAPPFLSCPVQEEWRIR